MKNGIYARIRSINLVMVLCVVASLVSTATQAQVKGLSVEKYYIADSNDLTDSTGGRSMESGAKTYRVFIELEPGSKVRQVYGDLNHQLRFSSTAVFYNNNDRPSSEFGYEIRSSWFSDNPLLALDSWLTIGWATNNQKGVLKALDNDGASIAGNNNNGGTAAIPGGLLNNTNPDMGLSLSQADGLVFSTTPMGQWTDIGFKDAFGNDTTVFGPDSIGSEFSCRTCILQQNQGVTGASVDSNKVLIAQLTTAGELSFEINLLIEQQDAFGNTILVKYVANDQVLMPDEQVSPFLTYPPACGCTDPDYVEYSGTYSCLDPDSCQTLIVFGCMDPAACNYDPEANVDLPSLCCYPGLCNDLDIALVCPELNNGRSAAGELKIYPNPSNGPVRLEVFSDEVQNAVLEVFNALGAVVNTRGIFLGEQITVADMDLSELSEGVYHLRISSEGFTSSARFIMKN